MRDDTLVHSRRRALELDVTTPPFHPKSHPEFLRGGPQSRQRHTTATDHGVFCAAQQAQR